MKALRITLVALAGLMLLLLIAVTGGYFYLNSERGKSWLAEALGNMMSQDGLVWNIARIDGNLPADIRMLGVSAGDGQGTWFQLQALNLGWQPRALLSRDFRVDGLELLQPRLIRLPDLPQSGDSGPPPRLPVTVRIERFTIEDFSIEESAFGQAAVVAARGTMSLDERGDLVTRLNVNRTDAEHGRLALEATYGLQAETLSLDARFQTQAGGLLDQITGLPGLDLVVSGEGALADWQGSLQAASGQAATLKADLHVVTDGAGSRLTLDAAARVTELVPAALADLLKDEVTVQGDVYLQPGGVVRVSRLEMASDAMSLAVSGSAREESVDIIATLRAKPPGVAWVNGHVAQADLEALNVEARISGPMDQPGVTFGYELDGVAMAEPYSATASAVHGRLAFTPQPFSGGGPLPLSFDGVLDLRLEALPDAFGDVLDGPAKLAATGRLERGGEQLTLETARLELPPGMLELSGHVGLKKGLPIQFDLLADLPSLEAFDPISGLSLSGAAVLTGNVHYLPGEQALSVDMVGKASDPRLGIAQVDGLLGDSLALSATIRHSERAGASLEALSLEGEHVRATGKAEVDVVARTLEANLTAELPEMASVPELPMALSGGGILQVNLSGPLDNPEMAGSIRVTDLVLAEQALGDGKLDINLRDLIGRPDGSLSLELESAELGRFALDSDVVVDRDESVTLDRIRATAMGASMGGELAFDLTRQVLNGDLELESDELGQIAAPFGMDLSGRGRLALVFDSAGDEQQVSGTAELSAIALAGTADSAVHLESIESVFRLDGLPERVAGSARISLAQVSLGNLAADEASVEIESVSDSQADIRLSLAGPEDMPYRVDLAGSASRQAGGVDMRFEDLTLKYQEQTVRLAEPATLTIGPEYQRLDPAEFAIDGGSLVVSGQQGPDDIEAMLDLESLPLAALWIFPEMPHLEGLLSSQLQFSATPAEISGSASLRLQDVGNEEWDAKGFSRPGLVASGEWDGSRFDLHGELIGLEDVTAKLEAALPVAFDWDTRQAAIQTKAPLSASAHVTGDLAEIEKLLTLAGQEVGGRIEGDLRIGGNLDSPQFDGSLSLEEGRYASLATGTELTDIGIRVVGDGTRGLSVSGEGRDGGDGRVSLTGRIDPASGEALSYDLSLDLSRMLLVNLDDIQARASGHVLLDGDSDQVKIGGEVTADRLEIWLGESAQATPDPLDVIEVNLPGGNTRVKEVSNRGAAVALDLALSFPRRIHVRGSGLESEWAGDLHITGNVEEPAIAGALRPVRGRYTFLGRVFELRRGSVRFDGESVIDPLIDLPFEHSGNGMTATVAVTGTASAPEIGLSSRPPLPESEIVSRVLFGTDSNSLTQGQQIELASSLATLRSGGPGILDRARRRLGVDVLSLGGGENGDNTTVRAGRYLTERVYLEVEQGAERSDGSTTVEVEVAPNVRLRTGTKGGEEGRFGIKWRRDF